MEIEERLRLAVTERNEKALARRRRLYQLAKSLGFSAREAQVLSAHTEATIRNLAAQREQAEKERNA